MKSMFLTYAAMVVLMATGCRTSHRTTIQGSSQEALSDSSIEASLATDSVHAADATSVAALSSAQAAENADCWLRDTSSSTTVTEFGPDGNPVRVTETRHSDITLAASVRRMQQMQVDAYMQQVEAMSARFDRTLMELRQMQQSCSRDTLSQQAAKEPVVPAPVLCQLWIYMLGFGFVSLVVLGAAWWRKFRNSIDCY